MTEAIDIYNALFNATGRHVLYPYQCELLMLDARLSIINKSRQTGISSFLACHGLVMALSLDWTVLIVSPSERQSKHVMDYVQEFWRAWKDLDFAQTSRVVEESKHHLMFEGGGQIHCLPNSPSTIRGFRAHLIMLDEFAHFLNGTDREVFEAITPSVSRGGQVIVVSTPFGDRNLFRDLWHMDDPSLKKILIRYTDCPDLKVERSKTGSIYYVGGVRYDELSFRQEFCNEFIGEMTSEFPMSLIMTCVDPELGYSDAFQMKGLICVGGYDVARDVDMSVVHIYEVQRTAEGAPPTYVLRCRYRWTGKPFQEQYTELTDMLQYPTFRWFNMDATGHKDLHERLREAFPFVRGIHFTNELKAKLVSNLKRIYEEKRIRIPDEPLLLRAINSIQRKYSDTNYLRYDSSRDDEIGHADEFWAQALAVYEGTEFQTSSGIIAFGTPYRKQQETHKRLINDLIGAIR